MLKTLDNFELGENIRRMLGSRQKDNIEMGLQWLKSYNIKNYYLLIPERKDLCLEALPQDVQSVIDPDFEECEKGFKLRTKVRGQERLFYIKLRFTNRERTSQQQFVEYIQWIEYLFSWGHLKNLKLYTDSRDYPITAVTSIKKKILAGLNRGIEEPDSAIIALKLKSYEAKQQAPKS